MAKEQDLTPAEARAEIQALISEIGRDCTAHAMLNSLSGWGSQNNYDLSIYPKGITRGEHFRACGDTWRECIDAARAIWSERAEQYTATLIRQIALKIIEITADIGECTDRALRADFGAVAVTEHAAAAAEQANALAAGGPFSVVETTSANDLAA